MKLFYISNIRIPTEKAHGKQITKTCESFADQGLEVDLVVPTKKNNLKDKNPYHYYGVKTNFTITKIDTYDPVFLQQLIKGLYIKVQTIFFGLSLRSYLKKEKADIFYIRDFYLLPFISKFNKKIVWEVHDLPRNKRKYVILWNSFYRIVVITNNLKQELIDLGVKPDKIIVAHDAVDLEPFEKLEASQENLRRGLNLPLDKKIVMYSGHLYSWKGAHVLALAAKDLDPKSLVVFVGGTDKDITRFKEEFGNEKNIMIVGRVDFEQVPEYLMAADVLVLPNSGKERISSHYTSPMKLFEYMASGRPIVASKLPSIEEVLNNTNAVLVDPDSPKSLAQGINSLVVDNALADKISNKSLDNAKHYTWTNRAKTIIESFHD